MAGRWRRETVVYVNPLEEEDEEDDDETGEEDENEQETETEQEEEDDDDDERRRSDEPSNTGSSRKGTLYEITNDMLRTLSLQRRSRVGSVRRRRLLMARSRKDPLSNSLKKIRRRAALCRRQSKLTDFAVFAATFGIAVNIFEAELGTEGITTNVLAATVTLRCIVLFCNICLVVAIALFHIGDIQICLLDNNTNDVWVVINLCRLTKLIAELCVCIICPLPWHTASVSEQPAVTDGWSTSPDAVLSIAMFLRMYLLARFTVFHSSQFRDASARTVASMNHVMVNFNFILRTLMVEQPVKVLLTVWLIFSLSISWLLTQCERANGLEFLNSIWFTMATMSANGYGDIMVTSYCGRTLALITSLTGIGITTALVAVVRGKLQLKKAEVQLNRFVCDSKLRTQEKNAAASVLQGTWFMHKCHATRDYRTLWMRQRRFLHAITQFRQVKHDLRALTVNDEDTYDPAVWQKKLYQQILDIRRRQAKSAEIMKTVDDTLNNLHAVAIESLSTSISLSLADSDATNEGQQLVSSIKCLTSNDSSSCL